MRFRLRPVVWAALGYALVATVALWPSIRPGRTLVPADDLVIATPYASLPGAHDPHNLQLSDATFQFYPWFKFMAEGLRHGEIRQWNPTMLAGVPVTPNGNVSPYYPPSWLGAVMSPFDAYDLFVLLHLILGALGLYVLSRAVGARAGPAFVAGLLGLTASFWVHWSTHLVHLAGMVWTPWVLATTVWLLAAPSRRRVAALAAVVGLWLLGGSPQYVYYGGLALLGWVVALLVARARRGDRARQLLRPALAFAGAMVLGALVAAPVLLPTASTSSQVARERETSPPTGHVPLTEAIRAVVPDATGNAGDSVFRGSNDELRMDSPFVGVTGLLLAAGGVAGLGRGRGVRWALAAGVVAVVVLAYTGPLHRLFYDVLPGYDRFRASPRWLSLLPAFALPLAALGLQDVLDGGRRARLALVGAGGASAVAAGGWYLHERAQRGAPIAYFGHRALFAVAIVAVVGGAGWLARRRPAPALAIVAVAALVEVGFHTPRWYPSVRERAAYPPVAVADIAAQRGGRFVRVGAHTSFGPFAPDLSVAYGVDDVQGLSVLFPKDYDRFLRLIDDYGLYAVITNVAPPIESATRLDSPLLDVLDVRTVVAERDVPVPARFPRLVPAATEPWVYARTSPGPAVVVASATPATEADMWARIADPAWDPRGTAAVIGLAAPVSGGGGTVSEEPAPPDRERWDVEAPAGGFLRVSGRWDAGWSARVDGKPAKVLRADGVFRGVVVPPGHHVVRFAYRNPPEMAGRRAAEAAIVVLLVLAAPWPRRRGAGVNQRGW